jgi:gluconate 2-dehydrogenase gamma chain
MAVDGLSRRRFLGQLATAGAATLAVGCRPPSKAERPGLALDAHELRLCAAACERILPADRDPGAVELGVVGYIDRRLARRGRRPASARRAFRRGLGQLEAWTRKREGRSFVDLDPNRQDVSLASFGAEGGDDGKHFLHRLIVLTLEGALADPVYGGNRDKAGWRLVGFDAPCPNPRCE